MKLEIGMYVRDIKGRIDKIIGFKGAFIEFEKYLMGGYIDENDFVKASYNIIDILEKGDYVNGDKIEYIDDCKGAMREFYYDYENPNDDVGHWQEEIKTIITHEQMEQMAYKVGE